MSYTSHPTAIIDDGAVVNQGFSRLALLHVCGGAKIGKGVSLGQDIVE